MPLDYSAHYALFHPDSPGHRRGLTLLHHRLLASRLPADRSLPILDVGCGRGYVIEDLQALGYTRVSGIDIDAGQVGYARRSGLDVAHVARSEDFLAARPGAYGAILLLDVLEHVRTADQPEFLRAISRSLAPGGRLICSVPNAASSIGGFWFHNDYTHQTSFTDDSLTFLLSQTGFVEVRCGGIEFFPRPRFLFWLPTRRTVAWWCRVGTRLRRRAEFIAELGWERGGKVTLTPNLVATADKPPA
ncbi:MAG: class I SAM-dependent methyltransferase [Verrucomicrobia bacterium]|nr:class I SAM-dependent methyltransferase [Verrucomicrobiota bacterium]